MSDDFIDLRSINWTHGMFLTPEHFLRQEKYFDSLFLWLVRYCSFQHGLLGGGPRVEDSERGAARFDPVVNIDDTGDELKVTVSQCRGMTPGGALVDITPSAPVHSSFSKSELEGATDLGVYVLARPHSKEAAGEIQDSVNPQLQVGRRPHYEVLLDIRSDQSEWSLLLTRLRRAEKGLRLEKISGFIPPCALMSGHSELMHSFRQLNDLVASLADRYGALHRAVVDFMAMARNRGIELDQDSETLGFVSRMVLALEECAYEILDPLQPPRRFFQQMTRLIRSSALFLSLSPPTREYFRLLGEVGEVEFVSMMEQDSEALEMDRRWSMHEDLRVEVQKVMRSLERLERLEQALEGKYMDFRLSPSLERINFLFDRTGGEPVLYKSVAKPARPQAQGQELTFVFAPLRLEARELYRIVLVGDKDARFVPGDRLHAELRINPGEGYSHKPEYHTADHELDEQRNFAIDFRAPEDVVTINDLRVSLRSTQPVRSAILYVRARLMAGLGSPAPVRREPVAARQESPSPTGGRLRTTPVAPPQPPPAGTSIGRPEDQKAGRDREESPPSKPRRRLS